MTRLNSIFAFKSKIMRLLNTITIILSIALSSCTITNKTSEAMESWKGTNISSVIASWGPETRVTSDGKSGKVYTWDKRWQTNAFYDHNGTYQPPRQKNCTKNFYVNSSGVIYNWRWNGYCR